MALAVVTGASSGIGAATAKLLAGNGFQVIAAARRLDRLNQIANDNIEAIQLDVTDQRSVDNFVKTLDGRKVALLVNNAGGAFDSAPIDKADPAIWQKTYDVNVLGTLRVTKALLPNLRANGKSHIVIVTSTAGHAVYENGGSYTNAKFAELALAQTLRLELNGEPIRVTEIAPGMVKTEEFSKVRLGSTEAAEKVYEGVAEPLTAEDIAETIRWAAMLPSHVNIDSLVVRPVAQAANHKIFRQK
ncbi:MAG: SDR family oxidoreductase [Actinomycetales bacterium]|nr:SDR family oxidoreductase [Actinomycetales bacterium]